MNRHESSRVGKGRLLSILTLPSEREIPSAVTIRFAASEPSVKKDSPALRSWPRCGLETRKTVEPAPRQTGLMAGASLPSGISHNQSGPAHTVRAATK